MNPNITNPDARPYDIRNAEDLYRQLTRCLEKNSSGGSNPEALQKMQSLGLRLKETPSLLAEKVGSLLNWATVFYSPRKHKSWDGPTISGLENVRGFMQEDLMKIKTTLGRMSDSHD